MFWDLSVGGAFMGRIDYGCKHRRVVLIMSIKFWGFEVWIWSFYQGKNIKMYYLLQIIKLSNFEFIIEEEILVREYKRQN